MWTDVSYTFILLISDEETVKKQQKAAENCFVGSFMVCTPHQISHR
jgi:hypothetical protein